MATFPTQSSVSSPKPRVGLSAQLFGLVAGPSAWISQLALNYGLSSYACYPGDTPRQDLPPPSEHAVLLAINLCCLAVAFIGLAVSFWACRKVPVGDGPTRFLTVCGVLSAAIFSAAILFDAPSALILRLCWSASR